MGQLVYLRDQDARGRHKIQDFWTSVVYQVVGAPAGEGVVYTTAPVEELHKVRAVHRDMLKAIVRPDADVSPARAPPPPHVWAAMDNDYSSDCNLWLLVSETAFPLSAAIPDASWLPWRDPFADQACPSKTLSMAGPFISN